MPELAHRLLRERLMEQQRIWPRTPNRHVPLPSNRGQNRSGQRLPG
ncbi:MAG TPA: hypothetical protein VFW65_29935 [Pseudonocardiaceae bacterium]|nr:hypothetical protein [Pseudonocardiaceae bacterium]